MAKKSDPSLIKKLSSVLFKKDSIVMSQDYLAYYDVMMGHHPGIDYASPTGTPVYSPFDGKISVSGDTNRDGVPDDKYGCVIMEITVTPNQKYAFMFAHLSVISVKKDNYVYRGDIIGYSGKRGTGRSHLHVECRVSGKKMMAKYFPTEKDNKTNYNPTFILELWEAYNLKETEIPFPIRRPVYLA
ncbi:M23 family metallopeptidase [Azospirillum thiophilum]|uniref:M23 family metallopeptidase n=1 Tax=Azospirillum thiophilum TaxID=528244 RepID=UPI00118733D8|nr:M23 family metallopeptidase [Azospirillum thiophilum]